MVRSSVLFGGLLAGGQRCSHAAIAPPKKSSHRTAQHFSEPQPHRTSYSLRCWFDRLFSSEDFLQVDSAARTRHLLDLRSLLIEQHSSLTRYSICFQKTFLTFDPFRLDSGILDCRYFDERTALFSEIGARHSTRQIPCKSLSRPPSARTAVA